ncbi:hypothetical protein THRCLA_11568 [Thraustotheca clavata]|uniref:Tubby C-terminal domain-containing protein n=1 Tax=Thraustotheca clavata TaxID=74557 RepID=A0A1V9Y7E7_9STRA|nr:hypothetical protein THRCLA_11568 [Thraustotheca clavata]
MGACLSNAEVNYVAIKNAPSPITAIDTKFLSTAPRSLNMKHKKWNLTGDYTVNDGLTGTPYFQVSGSFFTMVGRKVLRDGNRVEIAGIKSVPFTFGRREVYIVDEKTKSESFLFTMDVVDSLGSLELSASVIDKVTGETHIVSCRGNQDTWNMVFYIDQSPVAKMRSKWEITGDRYFVDVAAGVDMALIALLCIGIQSTVPAQVP